MNTMEKQKQQKMMSNNINEILEDYSPNEDIFNEESDLVSICKKYIYSELTEAEKRVIILYAELGTQRDVARLLGVSAASINIYIKKIRKKLAKKIIDGNVSDKTINDKCNNLLLD